MCRTIYFSLYLFISNIKYKYVYTAIIRYKHLYAPIFSNIPFDDVILWDALYELAACVQQKQLALPLPELFLVDHNCDARHGCAIEGVFQGGKGGQVF